MGEDDILAVGDLREDRHLVGVVAEVEGPAAHEEVAADEVPATKVSDDDAEDDSSEADK